MTGKNSMKSKEPSATAANDREDTQGAPKGVGGSRFDEWNRLLVDQTVKALSVVSADASERETLVKAAESGLAGIGPRDEMEGMMAANLIAAHAAAMYCYHRAQQTSNYPACREHLNMANKLTRTSVAVVGALDRHRGKGQQK